MSKSEKFCYHSFGTNETEKIIDWHILISKELPYRYH